MVVEEVEVVRSSRVEGANVCVEREEGKVVVQAGRARLAPAV